MTVDKPTVMQLVMLSLLMCIFQPGRAKIYFVQARLDACWTVSSRTGCTKISTDHSPWIHTACDVDTASRWLVQTQASMRRYFNGIYRYLRAAKEGREKLHGHLVQPDSLGIALLAVASSGQLCTQVSTAHLCGPCHHCSLHGQ